MRALTVGPEDPRSPDIVALLRAHLTFCHETSPPEDIHAFDLDALTGDAVTFVAAREDGVLLGVGAVVRLHPDHYEIKSMHTAREARGRGVARHVLARLLEVVLAEGAGRVSLETGSMEAFAPARALYRAAGFVDCPPFGTYRESPSSAFLTLDLARARV